MALHLVGESEWRPPSYYLKKEYRNERMETPVDERGLVLHDLLIQNIKSMYHEGVKWQDGRKADVHHFYYPENLYSPADKTSVAYRFRELPFHKALIPRIIHEEIEARTIPAAVPETEYMLYRLESCRVAAKLFVASRGAVRTPRQARRRADLVANDPSIRKSHNGDDSDSVEYFKTLFESYVEDFHREFDKFQAIPPEFRLVDYEQSEVSVDLVASSLGRIGLNDIRRRGSLNLVPAVLAA